MKTVFALCVLYAFWLAGCSSQNQASLQDAVTPTADQAVLELASNIIE